MWSYLTYFTLLSVHASSTSTHAHTYTVCVSVCKSGWDRGCLSDAQWLAHVLLAHLWTEWPWHSMCVCDMVIQWLMRQLPFLLMQNAPIPEGSKCHNIHTHTYIHTGLQLPHLITLLVRADWSLPVTYAINKSINMHKHRLINTAAVADDKFSCTIMKEHKEISGLCLRGA